MNGSASDLATPLKRAKEGSIDHLRRQTMTNADQSRPEEHDGPIRFVCTVDWPNRKLIDFSLETRVSLKFSLKEYKNVLNSK